MHNKSNYACNFNWYIGCNNKMTITKNRELSLIGFGCVKVTGKTTDSFLMIMYVNS